MPSARAAWRKGHDLGVCGRIEAVNRLVEATGHDLAPEDDDRAHRDLAQVKGGLRLLQGQAHEAFVGGLRGFGLALGCRHAKREDSTPTRPAFYSWPRAAAGSTRAARRAGSQQVRGPSARVAKSLRAGTGGP